MDLKLPFLLVAALGCNGTGTPPPTLEAPTEPVDAPEPFPELPAPTVVLEERAPADAAAKAHASWRCSSEHLEAMVWRSTGSTADPAAVTLVYGPLHPSADVAVSDGSQPPKTLTAPTAEGASWMLGDQALTLTEDTPHQFRTSFRAGDADVPLICWREDEASRFRYQGDTGTCKNAAGESGRHVWPIERIRETRDAECAKLSGLVLGEEDLSYPVLAWDLRGADLSGADLAFAKIEGPLYGAVIDGISYGYAYIDGPGDRFTKPPQGCPMSRPYVVHCSQ
jgi:hypothetical protein